MACCQFKFRASFDILPLFLPFVQTSVSTPAIREAFGKRTEMKLAIREAFDLFGECSRRIRCDIKSNELHSERIPGGC